MKRILIIVSIIFISLFTVSCKYKYKESPVEAKEIADISVPRANANVTVTKRRYFYDEVAILNFNSVQGFFSNEGVSEWSNYNYKNDPIPIFSKIEIRFVINPTYDPTVQSFIYLTDYIDLTQNHGYNETDEPNLTNTSSRHPHLDGGFHYFSRDLSHIIPTKIELDPNLFEKDCFNYIFFEAKYTFNEEYVNAGHLEDTLLYFENDRVKTDTIYYQLIRLVSFYTFDDFVYFFFPLDPNGEYIPNSSNPYSDSGRYKYEPFNHMVQKNIKFELNRDLPHNW